MISEARRKEICDRWNQWKDTKAPAFGQYIIDNAEDMAILSEILSEQSPDMSEDKITNIVTICFHDWFMEKENNEVCNDTR